MFYYLTYEGAVDLETMDDELQRSAIEDQIANFGQTPIQLFRKKHPRRGPPIPIAHPLYFAPSSITLTSIVSPTTQLQSPVLFLDLLDSNIVVVNKGLTLSVKMWLTTQLQSGGNFTFSSAQVGPLRAVLNIIDNYLGSFEIHFTVQTDCVPFLCRTLSLELALIFLPPIKLGLLWLKIFRMEDNVLRQFKPMLRTT